MHHICLHINAVITYNVLFSLDGETHEGREPREAVACPGRPLAPTLAECCVPGQSSAAGRRPRTPAPAPPGPPAAWSRGSPTSSVGGGWASPTAVNGTGTHARPPPRRAVLCCVLRLLKEFLFFLIGSFLLFPYLPPAPAFEGLAVPGGSAVCTCVYKKQSPSQPSDYLAVTFYFLPFQCPLPSRNGEKLGRAGASRSQLRPGQRGSIVTPPSTRSVITAAALTAPGSPDGDTARVGFHPI